jgi:hypothetical protein
MTRIRSAPYRTNAAAVKRWMAVAYNDAVGIDRDIDGLLDSIQRTLGISRLRASVELVRTLSLWSDRRRCLPTRREPKKKRQGPCNE